MAKLGELECLVSAQGFQVSAMRQESQASVKACRVEVGAQVYLPLEKLVAQEALAEVEEPLVYPPWERLVVQDFQA